ncbi:MAG: hypothetical protein V3V05_06515 [Pontiella sp.]
MAHPDYNLLFEDRSTYVYAYLTGTDSFSASLSYWNEIADKTKALGYRKVLVHENLLGDITEGEVFELVKDLLETSREIQVALFDENNTDSRINARGQLFASNRGATVRIFKSLGDAEQWIKQDD